jgi:hypothetical protein
VKRRFDTRLRTHGPCRLPQQAALDAHVQRHHG